MPIVKSVISGDTVVLRGRAVSGPPPEKLVSLSLISVPRKDEYLGFESREFLRRLIIGKNVEFHSTFKTMREFGELKLDGVNVAKLLVENGLASVKPVNALNEASDLHLELLDAEKIAKSQKLGIHSTDRSVSTITSTITDDSKVFLDKYRNMQIPGIIEMVKDASTFRVLLNLPNDTRVMITLSLAGIPNVEDLIEPFAEEAKFMVESRLNHRDVHVLLQGLPSNPSTQGSPHPLFIGTINFPLGNISQVLLNEGYGTVNDWTLSMLENGCPEIYRKAESLAKVKKLRLWKNYSSSNSKQTVSSSFQAVVTRILGPDFIQIENCKTRQEQKVQFSSVRGPKRAKNDAGLEIGYYSEAVEFLRSRLIGKTVQINVDYVKPAEGEFDARTCVTLLNGDQNIAEAMVSRGLAQVIRHKKDDDNRSSKYDSLLAAEARAQSSEKGIWSTKDAPTVRISDISESAAKAKQYFPFLQKSGELSGIVEYCVSGSRFRVYVPSQSARITIVLAGVRVPRGSTGSSGKAEPFGMEALNFVNSEVLQRDITFSAQSVDKTGGIIGSLWLDKKNVAILLLEKGFGYVHDYSASQLPYASSLYDAESIAKNAKLGVWMNFDPNESIEELTSSVETLWIDQKKVLVSEFEKDSLYVQVMGPEINQLEKMMQTFTSSYTSLESSNTKFKVGDYCAAKFTMDNQWYRAQILQVSPTKATVRYIDYGNVESISISSIRALLEIHSIKNLPPQAVKVELAHIEFLSDDDEYFSKSQSLVSNREFVLKVLDKFSVLLYPIGSSISINEELLKSGYCHVKSGSIKIANDAHQRKIKSGLALQMLSEKDDLVKLIEAQDEAKHHHLNIWRYGDFQDDD